MYKKQCNDKSFMESRTLPMPQTISTSGLPSKQRLSAPITQSIKPLPSNPIILQQLKTILPPGEPVKQSEQESLPTAEELEANQKQFSQPNILTLTHEEFVQWRQVLGQFQSEVSKAIQMK
jgi:hypothetical protein